jgi:hypothetical protein
MLRQITESTQGFLTIHDEYETGTWEVLPDYIGDAIYFQPHGSLYRLSIGCNTQYNTDCVWISVSGDNDEYFIVKNSLEDDNEFTIEVCKLSLVELYHISPDAAMKAAEIVEFEVKNGKYRR